MWRRYFKRQSIVDKATIPSFRGTPLFLALMLWICTLPLIAIIALPFLGLKITLYLAGFLLVADLIACRVLCRVRVPKEPVICARCLKRLYAQVSHTQATKGEDQKKIV